MWPKIYDFGVVGWYFFVVVRSQQNPMYECNFESSLLLNCFIRKDFIVQIFRKLQKNLPIWHVTCDTWHTAAGGKQVSVLLSASVERFGVSRMRDFLYLLWIFTHITSLYLTFVLWIMYWDKILKKLEIRICWHLEDFLLHLSYCNYLLFIAVQSS